MWHKVAKVTDLKDGDGQELEIDGQKIALFRAQGKFYALQSQCPHRGGPLVQGHLEGKTVTCPWHGWEFDVASGACHTMRGSTLKTYKTKVEKNEVFIEV